MRVFFFNDTATTEIYTLSLHDALPILLGVADMGPRHEPIPENLRDDGRGGDREAQLVALDDRALLDGKRRSEEHTSELQSRLHLVCRLLLEKKKDNS